MFAFLYIRTASKHSASGATLSIPKSSAGRFAYAARSSRPNFVGAELTRIKPAKRRSAVNALQVNEPTMYRNWSGNSPISPWIC
jgi:hypothetical protein